MRELRIRVKERFDAESDVAMSYPAQTVLVHAADGAQPAPAPEPPPTEAPPGSGEEPAKPAPPAR